MPNEPDPLSSRPSRLRARLRSFRCRSPALLSGAAADVEVVDGAEAAAVYLAARRQYFDDGRAVAEDLSNGHSVGELGGVELCVATFFG